MISIAFLVACLLLSAQSFLPKFPKNLHHRVNPAFYPVTTTTTTTTTTSLDGIPKMFRWLTDQYPAVNKRLNDGLGSPNAPKQVDNFYLDMNGIIHPCTHGNADSIVILDETEMFKKIFMYTDRLFKLVKPKNVFYLAVDGVAPRAKMNQQRSRRFRSAKEAEDLMSNLVAQGQAPAQGVRFDSNCITPGTDFMLKLSLAMNRWIQYKMQTDPFWRDSNCKVIFSGPDVPGEGEHKVMDYIREVQEKGDAADANLSHVLYGLDADLIMLGLVTREKNFMLLREKMSVVMGGKKGKRGGRGRSKPKDMLSYDRNDFELLDLQYFKEMFRQNFQTISMKSEKELGFVFDLDRVVDDFVFMCMIVGNDFLSHLPHMSIENGALSTMLTTYEKLLPKMGGYLTNKSKINPARLEMFLKVLAAFEQEYFRQRGVEENDELYAAEGYAEHYYETKLKLAKNDADAAKKRRQFARDYLEGLHWCLEYYHNGCKSWGWYFPHLYSPLATDLTNLKEFYNDGNRKQGEDGMCTFDIKQGQPFRSLVQLLSVLPPQSAELLPPNYASLMDEDSPLAEYYPRVFETDANGKRQSWEALTLIPFIDEERMREAVEAVDLSDMTEGEKRRDRVGEVKEYDYSR